MQAKKVFYKRHGKNPMKGKNAQTRIADPITVVMVVCYPNNDYLFFDYLWNILLVKTS
jgi:hypothetical protein